MPHTPVAHLNLPQAPPRLSEAFDVSTATAAPTPHGVVTTMASLATFAVAGYSAAADALGVSRRRPGWGGVFVRWTIQAPPGPFSPPRAATQAAGLLVEVAAYRRSAAGSPRRGRFRLRTSRSPSAKSELLLDAIRPVRDAKCGNRLAPYGFFVPACG